VSTELMACREANRFLRSQLSEKDARISRLREALERCAIATNLWDMQEHARHAVAEDGE
jgi:hypothetical protein